MILLFSACSPWQSTGGVLSTQSDALIPTASHTPFKPSTPTLTATSLATLTSSPEPTPEISPLPASSDDLTITIVYNNVPGDGRLRTDWGFSALVHYREQSVLFDTGASGDVLLQNMRALAIDASGVMAVVLSHPHTDHIGGLDSFLEISSLPPVYVIPSFGSAFKQRVRQVTDLIEAVPGQPIADGILTTGAIEGGVTEQALVIRTGSGLVVVTGCAHPGVVRMIERAIELTGEPVILVMGGFHLSEMSDAQIHGIIDDFRKLGVLKVAPSHCSGTRATQLFAEAYGDDFIKTGVGSVITLGQ